jgi:hypothetical protein
VDKQRSIIFFDEFPKRFGGIMDYDLTNKVIIVTGANSGKGRAASVQLV